MEEADGEVRHFPCGLCVGSRLRLCFAVCSPLFLVVASHAKAQRLLRTVLFQRKECLALGLGTCHLESCFVFRRFAKHAFACAPFQYVTGES